jgi:hypothetical protein
VQPLPPQQLIYSLDPFTCDSSLLVKPNSVKYIMLIPPKQAEYSPLDPKTDDYDDNHAALNHQQPLRPTGLYIYLFIEALILMGLFAAFSSWRSTSGLKSGTIDSSDACRLCLDSIITKFPNKSRLPAGAVQHHNALHREQQPCVQITRGRQILESPGPK